MKNLHKFENTVLGNCEKLGLFPDNARVLLSVSGGPDSTALFYAMLRLHKKLNVSLGVAHLNHNMRGDESKEDAEFVQTLARENSTPCFVLDEDMREWVNERGLSFQEGARVCRKKFLNEVAEREKYDFIALGHIRDDQAETVLMNIFRGTGSLGLAGIPPRMDPFIRPLINCSRKDVLGYLDEIKASFRTDSSNKDIGYLRNRVRLELIPEIESNFAPGLKKHLTTMAELVASDEDYLSGEAKKLFEKICSFNRGLMGLDVNRLKETHPAVLTRVLRNAIKEVKGDLKRVEFGHISQICQLLERTGASAVVVPGDIQVARRSGQLVLERMDRSFKKGLKNEDSLDSVPLRIPGETFYETGHLTINAVIKAPGLDFKNAKANEAYIDMEAAGETVWVRGPQSGDIFSPLGSSGSKKLKSYLIDRKIARESRGEVPVLTGKDGDIIWVYGHQISEKFKVRPDTRKVLYLKGLE